MNTQVGKSIGIALLLAAGLIAALFATGVFAPGGAGAQMGPTATAKLVDMNDPATAMTTADDTLVITFSGLTRQAGHDQNMITITMEDALGTVAANTVKWKGGNQYGDTLGAAVSYATNAYPITIPGNIEAGTAILEIPTDDNTIDSNTKITALTIGRTDAMQTVSNVPISIAGAPEGENITLSPNSIGTSMTETAVRVTGRAFDSETSVEISAKESDGTTDVDINGATTDNDNVEVTASEINGGRFTATVMIPPQTMTKTITITAMQSSANTSSMATLYITDPESAKVEEATISSKVAGDTGVTMSFMFTAIQDVMDMDRNVKVTLTGVSNPAEKNIMVQVNDEDAGHVTKPSGGMFYITKADMADDNIMMGNKVKVTITGLTIGKYGETLSATVKQGGYMAGMVKDAGFMMPKEVIGGIVTPTPGPDPTSTPMPTPTPEPTPMPM